MTPSSSITECLATMKTYHGGTGPSGDADLFLVSLLQDQLTASIKETPSLVTDELISTLCDLVLNHAHPNAEVAEKMARRDLRILLTAAQANPAKGAEIVTRLEKLSAELLNGIPAGALFVENRKCYTSQCAVDTIGWMLDITGDTQNRALAALKRLALESPDARLRHDAQQVLHSHTCNRHAFLAWHKKNNKPAPAEMRQDLLTTDFKVLLKNTSDKDSDVQLNAFALLLRDQDGGIFNPAQLHTLASAFEKAIKETSNGTLQVELFLAARDIKRRLKI